MRPERTRRKRPTIRRPVKSSRHEGTCPEPPFPYSFAETFDSATGAVSPSAVTRCRNDFYEWQGPIPLPLPYFGTNPTMVSEELSHACHNYRVPQQHEMYVV